MDEYAEIVNNTGRNKNMLSGIDFYTKYGIFHFYQHQMLVLDTYCSEDWHLFEEDKKIVRSYQPNTIQYPVTISKVPKICHFSLA